MKKITLLITAFQFSFILFAQTPPKFEFRAVWVATVENIDWPSKKGLSVEEQKAEFIHLADMHKQNGMNALIVQIRPTADAFYPSQYEPWSEYLNGTQGLSPTPYYDPLQFMIDETHKRGMEFHAWLNPYRAVFRINKSTVSPTHITKIHPEWFFTYNNQKIFNPGLPEVRQFVASVVKDIVSRYDVDGIHMDDYFYPYKDGKGTDFPDNKAFEKYGNGLSKDDWRRSNCDSIIKLLDETIKSTNPRVKFGVSPFGVWRNKSKDPDGSNTKAGIGNYDDLYADILLWLKKGWIDYAAPQLYWEIGHKLCDYTVLLDWWGKHTYGRQMFIGHGIYRSLETSERSVAWKNPNELPNQIKLLRNNKNIDGSIYFNSKNFDKNPNGWSDSLRLNYYALPAIVPPMPWIDSIAPEKPILQKVKKQLYKISYNGKQKIKGFAVFVLPPQVDVKLDYATLTKIITTNKNAEFDRSTFLANTTDKIFIATISINNNISEWVEVK
ncbi:MAG: family 10 glycosylhydrolase [Bacteroidetes bacterium]|nr:family 10 glycosylhydrolase [Bacteroidota bacterium]